MRCELRSAAPRDVLKGTPEFNSVSLHRSIEGNTSMNTHAHAHFVLVTISVYKELTIIYIFPTEKLYDASHTFVTCVKFSRIRDF